MYRMQRMNLDKAISTLELEGTITRSDIRRQWCAMLKRFHPDKIGENSIIYAINSAYEYLMDHPALDSAYNHAPFEYYTDYVYIIDWSAYHKSRRKFQRGSTRHKAFRWLANNDRRLDHKKPLGGFEEGWNRCTKENAKAAGIDPATLRALIKRGFLRIEERKIRVDIRNGF